MWKIVVFCTVLCAYLTHASEYAVSECQLSTNKDLGDPQPLLLKPGLATGHEAFHLPTDNRGHINFKKGDKIHLNCPGGVVLASGKSLGKSSVPVECVSGNIFQYQSGAYKQAIPFPRYTCSSHASHIARYTNKTCLQNHREIEIGFPLDDGRFLVHLNICFDTHKQTTLYSSYDLTKHIKGFQANYPRPEFVEGGFFHLGNHKITSLYSRYEQKMNINRLLGLPNDSEKYIQKVGDLFLAKGHLTAKSDFVFGSQHRITFYYVNAVPQWHSFNSNNWNELEGSVRNFAAKRNVDLKVFTGTHGVTTLPHSKTQKDVELYLYGDGKGYHAIPVPQLFWKVLYEPNSQTGVAYIGVNNPYHFDAKKDVVCKDICNQLNWEVSWNKTSIQEGYSYCCSVDDLRRVVKNVPNFKVVGLLQ